MLPSAFPESLRAKIDSFVLVATATSSGGNYLGFSANRVDFKSRMIDIQPLGLIVGSTGASDAAVFLDHGGWKGRSMPPPPAFWNRFLQSGIGDYFLADPPDGLLEGNIEQLAAGHRGAFDALVREIRSREDTGATLNPRRGRTRVSGLLRQGGE